MKWVLLDHNQAVGRSTEPPGLGRESLLHSQHLQRHSLYSLAPGAFLYIQTQKNLQMSLSFCLHLIAFCFMETFVNGPTQIKQDIVTACRD